MKTIPKHTPVDRRLAELESESHDIINTYIEQVKINADSLIIKKLQNRLKEIRIEQWKLFDSAAIEIAKQVFPKAA